MRLYQKLLSGLLVVTMSTQMVVPAFSAVLEGEQPRQFILTDADGNTQIVDSSWEETYPTGTFAFSADQINLMEGAEDGSHVSSITLYRLGGTEGRAEADITIVPAAAQIDAEGTISYANAAGTLDYYVEVENPWSIAMYQPLGGTADVIHASEYDVNPDPSLVREDGSYPYYIAGLESADAYQWQVLSETADEWVNAEGATDALFYITDDEYREFYTGIRCIYTVDDVKYCTLTNWGEVYVPDEAVEEVPEIPEDFVNDTSESFYYLDFEGNEFDMYTFTVIFAEDEWEKTITFEALDDDLSEATEVIALQITEARGATLYDTARVATVAIGDDEPEIPSQIGFAVDEIYANKADGTVRIPLERTTDGLQYVVGAVYSVEDGTAVLGTDYSAYDESSTYFTAGLDYTYIDIDLIDNGITLAEDETGLYFTVTLTEVQGSEGSGILPGQESVKVYLYNTSVEKPENGNIATELYSDEEEDASADVTDTLPLIGKMETIIADAEEVPENAVGEYTPNVNGLARTHDYGALTFDIAGNSSYWKDYAEVAYDPYNFGNYSSITPSSRVQSNADTHEGYSTNINLWKISGSSDSGKRGLRGRWYTTQRSGSMELPIANMYDKYTWLDVVYRARAEESWEAIDADGSTIYFSHTEDDKAETVVKKNQNIESAKAYKLGKDSNRIYFWSDYKKEGVAYDAASWVQLDVSYLRRRTMPKPNVMIHTADDDIIEKSGYPGLHDVIKPTISMVAGKGGVTSGGDFYVGSQIDLRRGLNASSYQFASIDNGKLSGAVFFSSKDRSDIYKSAAPKDGTATLNLLLPGDKADDGGTINVVMDRIQNIVIDIAPSVPRQKGSDTEIDPDKIDDTWEDFLNERSSGITYTYSEADFDFSNGDDGFRNYENAKFNTSLFSGDNASYTASALKNVRSINFNLQEGDLILFNGRAYAGNEPIDIPVELYTSNRLVFYYYHKDYVTSINTMVATITEVHRYIDLDVSGTEGYGVVSDGDILLESLNDGSYTITDLTPRKGEDGEYHQIVLRVFYSMRPKSLVVPEGASSDDRAEIIPAFVTSLTGGPTYAQMTDEQKGYRYIDHYGTGSGKLMYGAEASAPSSVDIPLGGDFNPATMDDTTGVFTWNPDWRGNSYYDGQFADAEPLYIDGTAVGDRYPVGAVNTEGELTADGADNVENYLTSIQENDTFSICVRDTTATAAPSARAGTRDITAETTITGLESASLSGVKTYPSANSARDLTDPEADTESSKSAGFDSSAADAPMPEYNMAGQQTLPALDIGLTDYVTIEMDGQNLAFTIGLPLAGFGKSTDFMNQKDRPWEPAEVNGTRGQNSGSIEMVKSIFNTIKNKGTAPAGTKSPKELMGDSFDDYLDKLSNAQDSAMDTASHNNRGNYGIKVAGVEGSLALSISIVLKWNPLESRFHFNQMLLVLAGSIQFSYTAYLTPCPIFYVSVTVGFSLEVSLGLEASRVKKIATEFDLSKRKDGEFQLGTTEKDEWSYSKGLIKLGSESAVKPEDGDAIIGAPGSKFTITTKEKAIDIHFNGKLYVEAVDDSGNVPEGFVAGTISSDGEEDGEATIKLAKKVDGKKNDREYTVTFTVVDDGEQRLKQTVSETTKLKKGYALIDRVMTIEKNTSDVYFAGVNISPTLFLELAVGVGVEMFKIELFFQVSVGCSFALFAHDSEKYAGAEDKDMKFAFNEFSFLAALGFRVTALFFNFEFEAVKFLISYDRQAKYDEQTQNKKGWNFYWYAANKQKGGTHLRSMEPTEEEPENPLKIRVILPGEGPTDETLYSPEDNLAVMNPLTRAFSAPKVPFEFSGYSDSGHAFPLEETLLSGSTYKLVTAGDTNYLVYTVNNPEGASINATQLVISKVQETARKDEDGQVIITSDGKQLSAYGLVSLTDPDKVYNKLDNDNTGDLEFDAWVVDGDDIRVAWVSYTDDALDAYNSELNHPDTDEKLRPIKALAAAGKNTTVKSVTITTDGVNTPVIGVPETVSDNATDHGMYFSPSGAGDLIYYSEANYYKVEELTNYLKDLESYLGSGAVDYDTSADEKYVYGETDPTVDFQMYYRRLRAEVYGKTSYPTYALRTVTTDDTAESTVNYTIVKRQSEDWNREQVQIENVAMTQIGDDYYAAYNTAYTDIEDIKTDAGTTKEEKTFRKLYLQKLTADDTGNITVGTPVVLRNLVDRTGSADSDVDGVYVNGKRTTAYDDPYFANVNFLTGKLGELPGNSEEFDDTLVLGSRTRNGTDGSEKTFLIFEMNAETYVVPQESLESITEEIPVDSEEKRTGAIIPFFTKETAKELNDALAAAAANGKTDYTVESAPAVTNVTFGVDGSGNVTAVYTQAVKGTSSNALYMTKFDSEALTWGAGTMLAMHRMSVYEESVAYDWTLEETEAAFYEPDAEGKIQNFNFSKTSIGFAGPDQLLVITEGTLAELQETAVMKADYAVTGTETNDYGEEVTVYGKLTGLTDTGEKTYEMKLTDEGVYDTRTGIYALTFGVGERALGYAALHLSNYDFTPGSTMTASISFTNIGDTTIRASKEQPAMIYLMMDGETDGTSEKLAEWKVEESIAAGQEVRTIAAEVTLPAGTDGENNLYGRKLYFAVEEDGTYIGADGAFNADTRSEEDTAACITIQNRVEMGYENDDFLIEMVDADETTVTLSTGIHVGNRGTKDSGKTYLRFQYIKENSEGVPTYYPLDMTGHNLTVSDQIQLTREVTEYTLANGYLPLSTTGSADSSIDSMHGRTVKGTFTVNKDKYDTDTGTGSLNLAVTIVSVDSDGEEEEEYDYLNNLREISIEPETLFEAPAKLSMQIGSTIRMPIDIRTSTMTDPVITVTELADDEERNLSVLYYDTTHSAIVIMPGLDGEGIIRVADTGTNSYYDICYSVREEGEAINIYKDNEIFEWYVPTEDGSDIVEDDPENRQWEFTENQLQFAYGLEDEMPYRSDLAIGEDGYVIRFRTLADTIEFFFMGDSTAEDAVITVESDLDGFDEIVTLTSGNGTVGKKVEFHNAASIAHTVTVTVKNGPVRFDKMYETFADSLTLTVGDAPPIITFSRTLPEAASIDEGTEVPLKVYFADLSGLANVSIDGENIPANALVQESDNLWVYDLTDVFTANGSHWIVATDTAGNYTEKEVNVEWFSATTVDEAHKDPGAVVLKAVLVDKYGNEFKDFASAADAEVDFLITDENNSPITDIANLSVRRLEYLYENGEPTMQYMQTYPIVESDSEKGLYKVPTSSGLTMSGVYKITYVNESGILSECFVYMDSFDRTAPVIEGITINEEDGTITIHVSKTPNTAEDGRIVEVRINDWAPIEGEFDNGGYSFSAEIPIPERNGKYTLIVTDENGHVTKQEFEINLEDQNDFDVPDGIVEVTQMVNKEEDGGYKDNGEVIVRVDEITGGHYDPETSTGMNDLNPRYEVAIVPAGEEPDEDDWVTVTTVTIPEDVLFDDLAIGEYEVHIRDANNPDKVFIREVELHQHEVEITSVESENSVNDADSGWIIAESIGGLGDTEYCLTDVDGNIVHDWQDDGKFENLPAGSYLVVIHDKANRETNTASSDPIVIKQLYTVEIAVSEGGHAEINGTEAEGVYSFEAGESLEISGVPEDGYVVESMVVNGKEVMDPKIAYTIESLDRSYVIEVIFGEDFSGIQQALKYYETIGKYKIKHYISAEAGKGGSITPEGKTTVYYGDSVTYTITPDEGYVIDRLLVNGKRVPAAESYTFEEITGGADISVTFREAPAEMPAEPIPETELLWDNPFADISENSPYYDAVRYVYENGYMNGVSGSAFAPDTTLTRAMLVTILWRLAGCPVIDYRMDFTDVPQDTWYTEAVRWAAGCELVLGYGDGTFGPDDKITVEQLAVILYRYVQRTGGGYTDASQWMYDLPYADFAEIADWAREAMHWYVSGGIYTGKDGYLTPGEFASRALAAQMLYAMHIQ